MKQSNMTPQCARPRPNPDIAHYPGKWKEACRLVEAGLVHPDMDAPGARRLTFLELGGRYRGDR